LAKNEETQRYGKCFLPQVRDDLRRRALSAKFEPLHHHGQGFCLRGKLFGTCGKFLRPARHLLGDIIDLIDGIDNLIA
jgi:hypothetical protein